MTHGKRALRILAAGLAGALLALPAWQTAQAHHGDIHAYCQGNQPVIKSRPPGTEHVTVICRDGLPEFMVAPAPVPTWDPVTQSAPAATPPDFAGWVTVWMKVP